MINALKLLDYIVCTPHIGVSNPRMEGFSTLGFYAKHLK